jgi:hypothetical protein
MYTVRRAGVVLSLSEATLKSIILISHDPELIADTREICKTRGMALTVETEWKRALERSAQANLLIVDLVATLTPPHRISGYVRFAESKMSSPAAKTPIALVGPPDNYRLDGMVGWPGFLSAFVPRPVDEDSLHYLLDCA